MPPDASCLAPSVDRELAEALRVRDQRVTSQRLVIHLVLNFKQPMQECERGNHRVNFGDGVYHIIAFADKTADHVAVHRPRNGAGLRAADIVQRLRQNGGAGGVEEEQR